MTRFPASLLLVALAVGTAPVFAKGDIEAGKATAEKVCVTCHGADGNAADPQYPRLAGQYRDYLERALHEYKDGGRKNPIMAGFASTLSDEDISNLSTYYASLPGTRLTDLHNKVQGD